ncbi:hypothetical protein QYF36_006316 [Acer negundo]|nr:hypothetical protein QYF36_006316 [Acer negundo]
MTGEEIAGPAAPKVLRFVYFIGAGFILTAAINKYRELERKSLLKKQQEENLLSESSTNALMELLPRKCFVAIVVNGFLLGLGWEWSPAIRALISSAEKRSAEGWLGASGCWG